MGWDSSSPRRRDRWGRVDGGDDFRHDDPKRGRSRSSSRERYRRHRSRSSSPDRRGRRHSRSPDRGWSRGMDYPGHRRSDSPPQQQQPSWHTGPGAEVLPPWQQQHQHAPGQQQWQQPGAGPLLAPLQPGSQQFVSRWDTGSRDTGSRWDTDSRWDSGRSRGSDTDRDWDLQERDHRAGMGPGPGMGRNPGLEIATASVFIKGLPFDADESEVCAAFANFPNIQSVKVLRDRMTGRGKGTAFLDFASVDDARVLMESEARYNMLVGGQRLFLDYSTGPPPGSSGQGAGGAPALDWICDMCSAVNFARRLECYHCSHLRPANPKRVTGDLNEPSHILKVSGLEPHTSEEALYQALSSAGHHIVDMRVIKDKFTGAPRGFAFVELQTVPAAGSVMQACQGVVLPGQLTPLKICYAKAKESMMGSAAPGDAAGAAAAPVVAAAAVTVPGLSPRTKSGPLGWKPKEFNPDGSIKQEQQEPQQFEQPAATAAVGGHAGAQASTAAAAGAAGPGPNSEAAAGSAAAAAAAGVDAATIQAMTQAGFEYQASSGYWWDPKSGYFYDAKTQLYYHHSTNQWYQYNADTGQYSAVGGDQQQQVQQQQSAEGQMQQAQQQQQQKPADKRRRAVIGSAPQYNPEGLLAAAALAEERAAEERRIAAAKAARERQQEQQNKSVNKQQQPRLMQGKPGIGMLPGTGGVPAPAAPPGPPPTAQVVAQGNLQGVVYRSKWSQQRAAQQGAN